MLSSTSSMFSLYNSGIFDSILLDLDWPKKVTVKLKKIKINVDIHFVN